MMATTRKSFQLPVGLTIILLVTIGASVTTAHWAPSNQLSRFMSNPPKSILPVSTALSSGRSEDNEDQTDGGYNNNDDDEEEEEDLTRSGQEAVKFRPQCFLPREADKTFTPELRYFSKSFGSRPTMGCSEHIKISLVVGESDADQRIKIKDQLLLGERYNSSRATYFLVHGFMSSWDSNSWMCRLKDMVLNATSANVFIVDWSGGARPMVPIDYGKAVANTRIVAEQLAQFMRNLLSLTSTPDATKFHLLGHSLGAQICGFVGYELKPYDLELGRITALDPAGPCFKSSASKSEPAEVASSGYLDPELAPGGRRRLSASSAKLVVAIHTDSSLFGMDENVAHFDVYANGGQRQPSCFKMYPTGHLRDLPHGQLDAGDAPNPMALTCAHSYAHDLIDSLERTNSLDGRDGSSSAVVVAQQQQHGPGDHCHAVAYECSSWKHFTSGECGFCADDQDPHCFYLGLQRTQSIRNFTSDESNRKRWSFRPPADFNWQESPINQNDDVAANGEGDSSPGLSSLLPGHRPRKPLRSLSGPSYLASAVRHYIKTGPGWPHCLYQYQVVIAANRVDSSPSQQRRFYFRLPLEPGERQRERLVQVSHLVSPQSAAYYRLSTSYLDSVKSTFKLNSVAGNDNSTLDYYTALITFDVNNDCNSIDLDDDRSLCKPIAPMELGAQLLAAESEPLASVKWVALNYLSGMDQVNRITHTQLLEPEGSSSGEREQAVRRREEESAGAQSNGILGLASLVTDTISSGVDEFWSDGVARDPLNYYILLSSIPKSSH